MSEQLYRKIVITDTWSQKTWNGFVPDEAHIIWTDGTDIYYSNNNAHYKLDKATSTWSTKTWNGLTRFYGSDIWTDGIDMFISSGSSRQYKLNKATSTWEQKTWNDFTDIYASNIWTDGTDTYYSNGNEQYKLNKATSTWEQFTWNGLTSFNGNRIWTDGTDVYYSDGSNQQVLNKSTGTWSQKTWNGLTSFSRNFIWTDGTDVYYSSGTDQYMLDKSTSTWSQKTWNGLTSFSSRDYIWTDGTSVYYSKGSDQYILDIVIDYEPVTIPESIKVKDSQGTWHTVKGVSVRTHGVSGAAAVKLDTKVPCFTANGDVVIMYDSDGNILAHKSDIENVAALTRFAMYELRNIYLGETCPFDTDTISAEQVSRIYVDGNGYLAYNDVDDTEGENPRQMLEWNNLNEATIDISSIAGYPRYT